MPAPMPDGTRLAALELRVRRPEEVRRFYGDLLGLATGERRPDRIALAPGGRRFRLVLDVDERAAAAKPGTAGLFHLAIRVPDRPSLARVLRRLGERGQPLSGASDHGVSEALYLRDPEGNGVELYRDRPRDAWPTEGDEVAMVTEPLDLEQLLAETDDGAPVPAEADLGHVHLAVDELPRARAFYEALGLRVRQSTYPGATFLAAGDYHHHVGLNAWGDPSPRSPGTTGLVGFAFEAPGDAFERWRSELALDTVHEREGAVVVEDPIGARVEVRAEGSSDPT